MSQIDLSDVNSGYNLIKINENFDRIERVINEELLHRVNVDELPNSLETDVDMNGQHIYNLPKPVAGGSPLRVKDLFGDPSELLKGPEVENITAVAGQTVFTLSSNYTPGTDSMYVYRNGIYIQNTRYTETSSTTITMSFPADANDVYSFVPVAVVGGSGKGDSVTTGANIGTGHGVFSNKTGNSLLFKTLKAGSGTSLASDATGITISAESSVVTGSNLGVTGEGVFGQKSGSDLQFKKLRAGSNVTLSSDATGITINATGTGGGSSVAVYDNGTLKTSAASSLNFINSTIGASGGAITIQTPSGVYLNVKDYGATGNGTTDDSSAINAAIAAAKTAGRSVFFPDGNYNIATLPTQSGKVFLIGTGNSTLKGNFTYHDATFPLSADTSTPLTPAAPFFSAEGLNFQSMNSGWALTLSTIEQGGFISTFSVRNCKFYGNKGLYAKHMIGFEIIGCEFNNVVAGSRYESCTNGMHTSCRWQNQAESGVWITRASDQTLRFPGGENLKFINCEWAVCTYGLVVDQHAFLVMEGCLVDYCGVPLFLSGSRYSKTSNSYFGASNHSVARFSAIPGFIDPGASLGCAVYGRPGGTPLGNRVVSINAHNCEFVNYIAGSTNPVVVIDGFINGSYPSSAEHISFYDCIFYEPVNHSAQTLLFIKSAYVVRVIGNRFYSFNKSSSLADSWRAESCISFLGHSNDFTHSAQGGVSVGSSYESYVGTVISASDPGARGPGTIWIQP